MKLNQTSKVAITIGLVTVLAMLIIPFITSNSGFSQSLPKTSKRVDCSFGIRNPVVSDNYGIEGLACKTAPSLFCEVPLSISGLSIFRSDDTVVVRMQSENTLPKSKTITVPEGIISGTLADVSINLCVPKENNKIKISIAGNDNVETDSKEVAI